MSGDCFVCIRSVAGKKNIKMIKKQKVTALKIKQKSLTELKIKKKAKIPTTKKSKDGSQAKFSILIFEC